MKRFISVLLVCLITCATALFGSNVQSVKAAEISTFMSDGVIQYVKDNENLFIEVMLNYAHYFNIEKRDADKYYLAKPYLIYLLVENQDEIYYYPIVDSVTGKIVANVGIIVLSDGYTFEIQTELCDILNEIDYLHEDVVIYVESGKTYASSSNLIVFKNDDGLLYSENTNARTINNFNRVKSSLKNLTPVIPDNAHTENGLSALMGGTLTLINPQGQYSYNLCWASSAATVINYLKSTSVTGQSVCLSLGYDFNRGGNMFDVQAGLSNYNVSYSGLHDYIITWNMIKDNIDDGYPVIMGSQAENGAGSHATVLYGYYMTSAKTVCFWNPALNNGSGAYSTVSYTTDVVYTMSGVSYTWVTSLTKS